ncbi:uncharacterized protein SAPINGB_P004678 [Magnusiomyces paraingens]|uniref:Maintenance of telomere capping protein 6 n=1 Tax=Magnusiomyces paraingens TaxID=2606893 RepID=A0A5E8C3A9_9ASCO|nr:uncharacterized protein SAPINGB_P004678 [Saprochaete ingens]VVT55645.1 unnamed protein product [Saprochaete ingens]
MRFLLVLLALLVAKTLAFNLVRRDDNDGYNYQNTICETLTQEQCKNVTSLTSIQSISQRDAQLNISITGLLYMAFDLNSAYFDSKGYTQDTIQDVPQILFLGFTSLDLDLYWNERLARWQLCPFDISQDNLTQNSDGTVSQQNLTIRCSAEYISPDDLLEQYDRFLKSTNNDLTTSFLRLHLRLHSLDQTTSSTKFKSPSKSQHLAHIISNHFTKTELYTLSDLESNRKSSLTYGLYGIKPDSEYGFPKVFQFLLVQGRRIIVSFTNMDISSDSTYDDKTLTTDSDTLFNTTYVSPRNVSGFSNMPYSMYLSDYMVTAILSMDYFPPTDCYNTVSWEDFRNDMMYYTGNMTRIVESQLSIENNTFRVEVVDSEEHPFNQTTVAQYISCGFVPKFTAPIANLSSLVSIVNAAIWSWRPNQPNVPSWVPSADGLGLGSYGTYTQLVERVEYQRAHNLSPLSSGYVDVNKTTAWRCAVLDETGWRNANCFDHYPVLCGAEIAQPQMFTQNNLENEEEVESLSTSELTGLVYTWSFGENTSYFNAVNACPYSNHSFTLPHSNLQDTSVRLALAQNGTIPFPIWIDFNSINAKDCWVSGGPLATCPYTPNTWTRSQVVLISVVSMVIALILIAVYLLSKDKTPVRHSEGKFKKIIVKFNQNQYHGVPS